METRIPTDEEYRANERRILARQLRDVEDQSLADRREARDEWQAALRDPRLIRERAEWLIEGCYGKGAYDEVRAWSARSNRTALLGILLAALEWNCSRAFARSAYLNLNPGERDAVDGELRAALEPKAVPHA